VIAIEQAIVSCKGCTVIRPSKLKRRLRRKPSWDPIVWHLSNGKEAIACRPHETTLIERGGWDKTGVRQ
jgi:hypothetical protein